MDVKDVRQKTSNTYFHGAAAAGHIYRRHGQVRMSDGSSLAQWG